jgi:DNA ligase 1
MFRPLLSPREDPLSYPNYFKELQYPLLISPKYDGIRAIVKNGKVLSRSGKPLPSFLIQDQLKEYEHFDGEIIVGDATDYNVYNRTQSHVMSHDKVFDFHYYVFDYTNSPGSRFIDRIYTLKDIFEKNIPEDSNVKFVTQFYIENEEQLLYEEERFLKAGYEGIMLRSPLAPYKQGRGTWREGIIMKLKRFSDDEGFIIGLKEKLINTNEQEVDELGYAKRSYKKEGKVRAGMVGAFYVSYKGLVLEIAPGAFKHKELIEIWENEHNYIGRILKFRYFNHGIKDKPRFPRAIGFRDRSDL